MRFRFWLPLIPAGLIAGPTAAQTTPASPSAGDVAASQALAALDAANIANANAKATADLTTLKAIQDASAGGSGGGADYDKSAEALLVSHYSMVGAGQRLASDLRGKNVGKIMVVWGSAPPPVGPYVQFVHDKAMLDEQLNDALADWRASYVPRKAPAGPPGAGNVAGKMRVGGGAPGQDIVDAGMTAASASNPVGLAITAATTLASVGRIDTTVSGVAVDTDQEQSRAIVLAALAGASIETDYAEFEVPAMPTEDDLGLTQLVTDEQAAAKAYREQYLPLLASAGKDEKLPAAAAAAGAELSAAIAATDAFRRAAFASTNGVSAATGLVAAGQMIAARRSESILFLRHVKTAATLRGNKGFFVGLTRSPSDFEAATAIDYLLLTPETPSTPGAQATRSPAPIPGSAVFYSGVVHLWRLADFVRNHPEAGTVPGHDAEGTGDGTATPVGHAGDPR